MILPRVYRINADRDLALLQNDLLMFQENVQLKKLRSGSCLFEQAKQCNHCFQCLGLIHQKKPGDLTVAETARLLESKIYQLNLSDFSEKLNDNFRKNGGFEEIHFTLNYDIDQLFSLDVSSFNPQTGAEKPVELMGKGMRSIYMLSLLETYITEPPDCRRRSGDFSPSAASENLQRNPLPPFQKESGDFQNPLSGSAV